MSGFSGKLVLLKIGTGPTAITVATARQNSFTISHTQVDTTTKRDNGWGSTLAGGGTSEMTFTLEGVFLDEEYDNTLRGYAFDGSSNAYTIVTGNGDSYSGNFVITSQTVGGDQKEAETFSYNFRNDGAVVFSPAA